MNIKKYKILVFCLSSLLLSSPAAVFAGAESGFYLGASLGDAASEANGSDPTEGAYSFDESDSGYKIFGGYNFGVVPLIDFAIEASYVDFGNPTGAFANGSPISYEVTGINAFALFGLNFGPFGVFAKAGVIDWDYDSVVGTTSSSDSGTDPAYGIGAKFQISSIALRAEYEVYDLSGSLTDITMLSLGAAFTF